MVFAAAGTGGRSRRGDAGGRRDGRDGDRRDPPLRGVRARGPLPVGRARPAHVVGPVGARASAARPARRSPMCARSCGGARRRCRSWRSGWPWSSRGTRGGRSSRSSNAWAASPSAGTRSASWGGAADASDPLLPAVEDVAPERDQAQLRRRDRGRRRPRAGHRLRAREARRQERGGAGEATTSARAAAGATPRSSARTTARRRVSRSTRRRSGSTSSSRQELDYNLLFSQQGHLTLAHAERAVNVAHERAEVNRLLGVDSRVIYPDEIAKLCPALDLSDHPEFPIMAALYHPPGGVIRHDAVVWGYARQADRMGVHIHQDTEVTGIDVEDGRVTGVRTTKGDISTRVVISAVGRVDVGDRRDGRRPHADRDAPAAGVRHGAAQAVPRRDPRVGDAARVRRRRPTGARW